MAIVRYYKFEGTEREDLGRSSGIITSQKVVHRKPSERKSVFVHNDKKVELNLMSQTRTIS